MSRARLAAVLLLGLAGVPGGLGLDVTVTSDDKINCGACKVPPPPPRRKGHLGDFAN